MNQRITKAQTNTMKKLVYLKTFFLLTLVACQEGKTPSAVETVKTDTTITVPAFPVKDIIVAYLQVKNALVNDKGGDAAAAGKSMVAALERVDMNSVPGQQMKTYIDLAADLKEHASHIAENAGKIAHQREHFEMMSSDMADFIKIFGNGGQQLYKDFCPMANEGKGAFWISELKEIRNPYLGKKMPECGIVKEELK